MVSEPSVSPLEVVLGGLREAATDRCVHRPQSDVPPIRQFPAIDRARLKRPDPGQVVDGSERIDDERLQERSRVLQGVPSGIFRLRRQNLEDPLQAMLQVSHSAAEAMLHHLSSDSITELVGEEGAGDGVLACMPVIQRGQHLRNLLSTVRHGRVPLRSA